MSFELIDSGVKPAEEHMAFDLELLNRLEKPTLHFYQWQTPTVTHGYFIDPAQYLHLEKVKNEKLTLAKRPTGGGIIFHLTDFAFSFLLPKEDPNYTNSTLENYAFINGVIKKALVSLCPHFKKAELLQKEAKDKLPFCMAHPTVNDLMIEGKKVAGGAQRRKKRGYLHQASLSLSPLSGSFESLFRRPIVAKMNAGSFYLLREGEDPDHLKQQLKQALVDAFYRKI